MNEHKLTFKLRLWFDLLADAGAPLRAYKNHGSGYSRDRPDWFLCVCRTFVAIETKNPEDPEPPTKKQERELRLIAGAGGVTLVSHDEAEIKRFVSKLLFIHDYSHALTEPYL